MNHGIETLMSWFVPASADRSRSEIEMARVFVFTHLFGPILAQPMIVYLAFVSQSIGPPLVTMIAAICSFWLLPFILRFTDRIGPASFCSFQLLAATSLFGTFFYGGFSSPFLPWLIVALLLGLFYHARNQRMILTVFVADIGTFLLAATLWPMTPIVPVEHLNILGWMSLVAAAIYMAWMAIYYSNVMALRDEVEAEAERYRIAMEELRHARAAAERSSVARHRFFSKMSHELRTPLNAIIGFSEILLEDCEMSAVPNATRVSDIGKINAAGRHLLSLVSNVLTLDAEAPERIQPSSFTLGELCDEVLANTQPMVERNGNRLVVTCPDRSASVISDRTMLRQMLLNLLSNAAKFTSNGTVHLEIAMVSAPDEKVSFSVSDTGIGISQEAQSRLFSDYEQAEPSTSAIYGGTGLGLALTRRQTILLGGDIAVTSRPGDGSRFTIILPAHLQTSAATSPNETRETSDGNGLQTLAA